MRRRLAIIIPAILLAVLVVWRLGVNQRDKSAQLQAASARKKAPANVQVATAQVRDIVHLFQGVAEVEAPADVRIAPKVTGRLDYLQVREGDRVTRGEVLARIDPSQVQALVNQQQAAVESARSNAINAQVKYNRYYSLYKQGFVAAQDVDDYRTQRDMQESALRAAEAQLRNAQSQLSDTILRSPVNGFVTARFFDPGSVVTAGQPIVTVQTIRNVFVTTSVPEGINRQVHEGMEATVTFDAIPGREFKGKVTQVNTSADPQSRQFLVRASLPNPQSLIRPGMFCRMTLVTKVTRNAVVVPHEALSKDPKSGGQVVTVIDAKLVAHKRPVTTGDSDLTGVQIVSGVQPGERVVVLSAQPVRDGQQVRIDQGGQRRQPGGRGGSPTVAGGGGGVGGMTPPAGGPNAPTYSAGGGGAQSSGGGNSSGSGTGAGGGANGGTGSSGTGTIGGGGSGVTGAAGTPGQTGFNGSGGTGGAGGTGISTGVGASATPNAGSGSAVGTGSGPGGSAAGSGATGGAGAAGGGTGGASRR